MRSTVRRIPILVGWTSVTLLPVMLSLSAWLAEGAIADFPTIEIEVHQSQGAVEFLCYWAQREADGRRIPVRVQTTMVAQMMSAGPPGSPATRRGEPLLWHVRNPKHYPMSSVVTYGVIPAGFVQDVPSAGPAPPLVPNQGYQVGVNGEGGMGATAFVYKGP